MALVFVAACGDGSDRPDGSMDLAAGADDLAVVDLGVPMDLRAAHDLSPTFADAAGFCDDTIGDGGLASSCARAFFQKLVECYVPTAPCLHQMVGSSESRVCWSTGAWVHEIASAGFRDYYNDDLLCMSLHVTHPSGQTLETWTAGDGTTLLVNENTGDVTCPDGSHSTLASESGYCPALSALVQSPSRPLVRLSLRREPGSVSLRSVSCRGIDTRRRARSR